MCGESPDLSPVSHPQPPLLTKVEVAALILGLEEAPSGLGVHVGSLGHQQLHVVFAAALYSDVQGGLAWGGRQPGSGMAAVQPHLLRGTEWATRCGNRARDLKAKPWPAITRRLAWDLGCMMDRAC